MAEKMMVVDDARVVRVSLGKIMQSLGFEVIACEDGQQAMQAILENPDVRLIMLDWHMPVMNGYDFLVRLREMPEHSSSPLVVMVTTEASMPSMMKALSAGADEYIMKPFDASLIKSKLDLLGVAYKE
ncbi:MAG: response regulator [Zetaproteobacteria bacterium CG06_land_8_20_14_3_00_59_53]|nr:MAG: response regulator [Zetaproteobacteria bacterium CG2_30_59_37]PIO90616.1 MAG: response regulator [Zetaproteobacteria bacterium CG23_combo_of_CG06-09_8_20_14_all_59_86]PIQ66120.1 MAG: response regulator [Zetaproteobacteria bacterium CG11_big_fil_rev_8_21_14_0_20_59_439]PIU71563.1 MAG: response regulator [Zetaproteobacteria bacterium CG06_land_8_20_14_3_00_59_53]PIU97823.1 MAG: response regulator [Zetaproteobacteria bacterium CG03_land_8_20_14_0_80_59_51]PIY45903.1 MAG: response regulato